MPKRKTAAQIAASKRNLQKARAARKSELKQATSKGFVTLGTIPHKFGATLKMRPAIREGSSMVKSYGRQGNSTNPETLRNNYIKWLKGHKLRNKGKIRGAGRI